MKKSNKKVATEKLSLNKFSVARLNQMNAIKGGTSSFTTGTANGDDGYVNKIESIGDLSSDFFPTNG